MLVCPDCSGTVALRANACECRRCARRFRTLRGIPDLRTAEDGYLANDADWAFALALDEAYERLDFRGLLARYFELERAIPAALRDRQIAHILSAPERVEQWLEAAGSTAFATGWLLDLGCGSGSFLAALGPGVRLAWGVDIAMRWLLIARKRLEEEGHPGARLVCACAERLPFRDRVFSAIIAGDVIEHVSDQAATLEQAHRVLRPAGRLVLASPNRFSLAPEPHVGVWGVGFLPRSWMSRYVRLMGGPDFRAITTLSHREWTRLLAASPFRGGTVRPPVLPAADLQRFGPARRMLARGYNAAVRTRLGRAVALGFGPLFHVTCTRAASPDLARGRATHRRSRRSRVPG